MDKNFFINSEFRNIRKEIFSYISQPDRMHLYGHCVYNTCSKCLGTFDKNELEKCENCKCEDIRFTSQNIFEKFGSKELCEIYKKLNSDNAIVPVYFCKEHIHKNEIIQEVKTIINGVEKCIVLDKKIFYLCDKHFNSVN